MQNEDALVGMVREEGRLSSAPHQPPAHQPPAHVSGLPAAAGRRQARACLLVAAGVPVLFLARLGAAREAGCLRHLDVCSIPSRGPAAATKPAPRRRLRAARSAHQYAADLHWLHFLSCSEGLPQASQVLTA